MNPSCLWPFPEDCFSCAQAQTPPTPYLLVDPHAAFAFLSEGPYHTAPQRLLLGCPTPLTPPPCSHPSLGFGEEELLSFLVFLPIMHASGLS